MLDITNVQAANAQFTAQRHFDLVGVFGGATAGIGAATLGDIWGTEAS